jgi:DNA-directed RNA polymerase specialized sigma24 family protein
MSSEGSVTGWLGELQAGRPEAAQPLWERYFARLVGLARLKLRGTALRVADEEDVALSAFDSFFRGAEQGRFPRLDDRENLWQLLVVITARKASNLRRHENRQKRGGRAAGETTPNPTALELEQVIGREPTPAFAAQLADECRSLFALLPDAELRSVAQLKLEGDTNPEIAAKLGCALRSVERKLGVIRSLWGHRASTDGALPSANLSQPAE